MTLSPRATGGFHKYTIYLRNLPKGSPFDDLPNDYIEWVEDQINGRPMQVLGLKVPKEIWNKALESPQSNFYSLYRFLKVISKFPGELLPRSW